jgi:DNA-directed RNA polymerase specialized sigma24 family protein
MPEVAVPPDPPSDPGLARAIAECWERLAGRPLEALRARISRQYLDSDRDIASALGMSLNAFLQNIVRARRQMAECLESRGVRVEEVLR